MQMRLARFVVVSALSYLFWRNRFKIQQFVESQGVSTPLLKGNFVDTIRSGFARVTGQAKRENELLKDTA